MWAEKVYKHILAILSCRPRLLISFLVRKEVEKFKTSKQTLSIQPLHCEGNKFSTMSSQAKQSASSSSSSSSTRAGKRPARGPSKQPQNKVSARAKASLDLSVARASQNKNVMQRRPDVPSNYLQVAQQILAPATCSDDIIPTPNSCRRYVVPRRYRRVFDFQAPATGQFTVAMFPNLFSPGYISNGAVHTIPASVAGPLSFTGNSLSSDANARLNTEGKFYNTTESLLVKATDIADVAALVKHGYLVNSTGTCYYSLFSHEDTYTTIEIWKKITATNTWTLDQTLQIAPRTARGASFSSAIDAIAFVNLGPEKVKDKGFSVDFNMTVAQYTSIAGSSFAPAFASQITDLDISEGRVISMSMKITNTSALIARSGNISIGRVPHNFSAFSDISSKMSVLPRNRAHQDAADHGGYVFWMPEEYDEWEFDSISNKTEAYTDANYLIAHLNGLPLDASFRLTFGWVVEFYTPSQNFPKVPTPIASPYWLQIQSLLVDMDAACCNPESAGMFQRFLNSGISAVKNAQDHYSRNKETYQMLMAVAKHLAQLAL